MITIYAAPSGEGDGLSTTSPIGLFQAGLLKSIQQQYLSQGPVKITLLPGTYQGHISEFALGHPQHTLTFSGVDAQQVIFRKDAPHATDRQLLRFDGCQNIRIEHLTLTGTAPYLVTVMVKGASQNMVFEDVHWLDMPHVQQAGLSLRDDLSRIAVRNCHFARVGADQHAHFIYCSNHSEFITVEDCSFLDCPGSHVRFRNGASRSLVTRCQFRNTGTFPVWNPQVRSFLELTSINPQVAGGEREMEAIGTDFTFSLNTFTYDQIIGTGLHWMLRIWHLGWSHPDWDYLLSASDLAVLQGSDQALKRTLLMQKMGIDPDRIILHSNNFNHPQPPPSDFMKFAFYMQHAPVTSDPTGYPPDPGGSQAVELYDLIHNPPPSYRSAYPRKLIPFHS